MTTARKIFLCISALLILAIALVFIGPTKKTPGTSPSPSPSSPALGSSLRTISSNRASVSFGNTIIKLELAHTPAEKQLGLGGRTGLEKDSGMFFFFDENSRPGIWMKDMLFSIDILWLDESLRVVSLSENVSPDTYPQVFRANAPSSFVLELPAGYSRAHSITLGSQFVFPAK